MNMIQDSAGHEAYKQQVLKQFEEEACAKFASIENITADPEASLFALTDIEAVRGLTPCEKRIKAGLIKLLMVRAALSCFTPAAHALKERRMTP